MAKKMTAYILKSIFYFAIISDIQERCKDGTESSYVSFTSSFTVNLSCYHITFAKLTSQLWASLMARMVKNACNAGNLGSIPRLGRIPLEKGMGSHFQCSCLEDSMDREAWQAPIHGVTKSWT